MAGLSAYRAAIHKFYSELDFLRQLDHNQLSKGFQKTLSLQVLFDNVRRSAYVLSKDALLLRFIDKYKAGDKLINPILM